MEGTIKRPTQDFSDDLSWTRFQAARGELYTGFESRRLLETKLKDDLNFHAFQKSFTGNIPGAPLLLPHLDKDVLSTCAIPATTTGEWFSRVTMGRNVTLGENVNLLAHGGVTIGDNASIGPGTQIITIGHGIHPSQRFLLKCAPIIIEEGAKIGRDVLIVHTHAKPDPIIIGKDAVVLPGSIVTADVEPGQTVGGRPAKPIIPFQQGGPLLPHWNYATDIGTAGTREISTIAEGLAAFSNLRIMTPLHVRNPENIHFGQDCFVNRNTILRAHGKITTGNKLQIAPAAVIQVAEGAELHIGDNVWIGAGARITVPAGKKVTIGTGAIVACGAEITENVEPMTLVGGENRLLRKIDDSTIEKVHDRWKDPDYVRQAAEKSRAWNREQRLKAGL